MASHENGDDQKVLEYRIYKCSSYSSTYAPENILVDKPSDQTSRWSSDIDNHPQYLTLKLQRPAIVESITFGKYEKTHVCNIKKFKVYGGLDTEVMIEILDSGLKNDSMPETFEVKHTIKENYFPVQYIKILPLQSWGPSFNFSIWHVRLSGIDEPKFVKPCIDWLNTYRRQEVIRLCMKHFRRMEQPEIFETLQRVTGVALEDPQLTMLYDLLVVKGDYTQTERFIGNAVTMGLVNDYINAQSYRAIWTKLTFKDPKPGMRGGHQMVLDPTAEILYLFGGWDGNQDLADLWSYDIATSKWVLICKDTEAVGGPCARSCHKMCLDPKRRQLFTLGRYLDTYYRTRDNIKSDFYVYDIESNKWTQITEDTGAMGGPQLIFDHQMSMDVEKRTIYVFGGRVLVIPQTTDDQIMMHSSSEPTFSGLYSYHVPTGTWTRLACDTDEQCSRDMPTYRSRAGHSMLFHPGLRKLYIFAGQRGKEYLSDFFTYDVDTHHIEYISYNDLSTKDSSNHMPAAGFTQRATIDSELGEIYVLSGMSKDKDKREDNVQNSFWVYNIRNGKWNCIYRNENVGEKYWNKMQDYEPCPRFAHQIVYDHIRKVHFLFGGNPGRFYFPNLRLDDFWQLELRRPSCEQILKKCKLIIRKHKFQELALSNSIEALEYLQTRVSEIIDHEDTQQTKEFQSLTSVLFQEKNDSLEDEASPNTSNEFISDLAIGVTQQRCIKTHDIHNLRIELYDKLTEFFPESLAQPRANLINLVPL